MAAVRPTIANLTNWKYAIVHTKIGNPPTWFVVVFDPQEYRQITATLTVEDDTNDGQLQPGVFLKVNVKKRRPYDHVQPDDEMYIISDYIVVESIGKVVYNSEVKGMPRFNISAVVTVERPVKKQASARDARVALHSDVFGFVFDPKKIVSDDLTYGTPIDVEFYLAKDTENRHRTVLVISKYGGISNDFIEPPAVSMMAESAVHSGPQLVERYALINGISPNGKMWYLMMIEDGRTVKVDRKLLPQDTPLGSTVHLKIWKNPNGLYGKFALLERSRDLLRYSYFTEGKHTRIRFQCICVPSINDTVLDGEDVLVFYNPCIGRVYDLNELADKSLRHSKLACSVKFRSQKHPSEPHMSIFVAVDVKVLNVDKPNETYPLLPSRMASESRATSPPPPLLSPMCHPDPDSIVPCHAHHPVVEKPELPIRKWVPKESPMKVPLVPPALPHPKRIETLETSSVGSATSTLSDAESIPKDENGNVLIVPMSSKAQLDVFMKNLRHFWTDETVADVLKLACPEQFDAVTKLILDY